MTLDEEITKLDLIASDAFEGGDANEFKQLAEWLSELKEYRKFYSCRNCYNASASFNDYPCCECRRCFKALDGIKDHYEEVNSDDNN